MTHFSLLITKKDPWVRLYYVEWCRAVAHCRCLSVRSALYYVTKLELYYLVSYWLYVTLARVHYRTKKEKKTLKEKCGKPSMHVRRMMNRKIV